MHLGAEMTVEESINLQVLHWAYKFYTGGNGRCFRVIFQNMKIIPNDVSNFKIKGMKS